MEGRELNVGDSVVFIDSQRRRLAGLVQAIHGRFGPNNNPAINLIVVSPDASKTDTYGRQIEHFTSVGHADCQKPVIGMCWHFPDQAFEIDEANIQAQR